MFPTVWFKTYVRTRGSSDLKSLAQLLPELYGTRSNYYYISGDFDGAINIQAKIHKARISEAGIPLKSTKKGTIRYLLFSNLAE